MKKSLVVLFVILWGSLSLYVWIKPSSESSLEERRKLKQFPELNVETVINGDFTNQFEGYVQDQFPHRFKFRQIKSISRYYGLGIFENNGYFIDDNKIMKIEYPLKENEVIKAGKTFTRIKEDLFTENNEVFVSIIPDKAYYSKHKTIPKLDYMEMENLLLSNMDFAQYIDIKDQLTKEDYYNTDIHWKHENIKPVANTIMSAMNKELGEYTVEDTQTKFTGVYYGHSALFSPKDNILSIHNDTLKSVSVDLLDQKDLPIYNPSALNERDQYDYYLYGPQAIVEIYNENADTDKELIVFRDSFGSSIAPYFVEGYKKVTLIDIRYISSSILSEYVEFNNQDILFLYNGTILNSSSMFK